MSSTKHPRWVVEDLARDRFPESAVCLDCGELQLVQEQRLFLGLCDECGARAVLPCSLVARVLDLIEEE